MRVTSNLLEHAHALGIAKNLALSLDSKNYIAGLSTNNTIYDLASLTKILGTTLALVKAVLENKICLKEEPFSQWPGITVDYLLAHTSGLDAHVKFYELPNISQTDFSNNKKIIFNNLFEQPIITKPGTKKLYSDLNFLALGWLLEKRYKQNLDQIFKDTWDYLKINHKLNYFLSRDNLNPSYFNYVAPTGYCPTRKKYVRAQVHDLNCYYLGGLAGHAGLFGDLASVSAFADFFLGCIKNPQNSFEKLIAQWAKTERGFHKPDKKGSTRSLSSQSFGHFGFTGTSLWVDPTACENLGRSFVLLTNRVESSLRPEGIFWLRSCVHK